MKLLERLKKIIHYNIQKDETIQNEDRTKIKVDESYENIQVKLVKEGKNPEGKNSEGMTSKEKTSEEKTSKVKTSEEKNPEEKIPEERNSDSVNLKEINSDSLQNIEVEYEIVEKEILPEKIICPDCGGITLEGLDFCDKCGGELYIYNR